jgi:hypothetical protein
MTTLDVTNATNPFHGVIGVNNQTTAAIPVMALTTWRKALRIVFVLEGWTEPARKLYPQSHRSVCSGLTNSSLGHSFIVWTKCRRYYGSPVGGRLSRPSPTRSNSRSQTRLMRSTQYNRHQRCQESNRKEHHVPSGCPVPLVNSGFVGKSETWT